jgi:lipopolysaccharide assembly outer membrane protein LptD (OstA)
MKRLFLGVLFIACFAVLASGQGVKREIPVTFRAVTQVATGSILHLKGAVRITTDQHLIHADEADFNVTTGDIEARGNVQVVKIGLAEVGNAPKAEWLHMNIDGQRLKLTFKNTVLRRNLN